MLTIEPINLNQQQQVIERVAELLLLCEWEFNHPLKPLEVRFDLSGRTSGMYVVKGKQKYFRFNPFIFSKFFEDGLATTVPHEVAHYVSDVLYSIKKIRPHGKEWQSIMQFMGVEPRVTGDYDLTGVPLKKQQRFDYACACMTHQLTTTRHNRVLKNKASYSCQKCGEKLTAGVFLDWYVYILRCRDNSLYTGVTKDLERRLDEHNHSKLGARYTRARRPVEMVYSERLESRSAAGKRECEIKGLSRLEKERLLGL
jgi:SprT protein